LAAFKKAVGAGDRNVVRETISESITQRQGYGGGQEKRGFLSKINPFSR